MHEEVLLHTILCCSWVDVPFYVLHTHTWTHWLWGCLGMGIAHMSLFPIQVLQMTICREKVQIMLAIYLFGSMQCISMCILHEILPLVWNQLIAFCIPVIPDFIEFARMYTSGIFSYSFLHIECFPKTQLNVTHSSEKVRTSACALHSNFSVAAYLNVHFALIKFSAKNFYLRGVKPKIRELRSSYSLCLIFVFQALAS